MYLYYKTHKLMLFCCIATQLNFLSNLSRVLENDNYDQVMYIVHIERVWFGFLESS